MRYLGKRGMLHFESINAFSGPPVLSRNLTRDLGKCDQLSWEHIERIRQRWKGNLVIKGILSPDDARLACDHGVDAIIVSNHGGRQPDGTVAPFDVLSEVVSTVSDAVRILFDGGVRRGTDVLKRWRFAPGSYASDDLSFLQLRYTAS